MAACRSCRTELGTDEVGCSRCSPVVDDRIHDRLLAHPRWSAAQTHNVRSRRGTGLILFGLGMVVVLLVLWPSASRAADDGDTSGHTFIAIAGVIAGLLFLGGVWISSRPLHRHAGVVLGTAFFTTRDSKGRTSTTYYVHLATRARRLSISINSDQLEAMYPGRTVIAFERWGQLDDLWDVDVGVVPAEVPTPEPLVQPPPDRTAALAEATRAAVEKLTALTPSAIARARNVSTALPLGAYKSALAWIIPGAVLLAGMLIASTQGPSDTVDDLEAWERRARIVNIVLSLIAGGFFVFAAWAVVRVRRSRLDSAVVVAIDQRQQRIGDTLLPRVTVVDASGAVTERAALGGVTFVLHVPLLVRMRAGEIVSAHPM